MTYDYGLASILQENIDLRAEVMRLQIALANIAAIELDVSLDGCADIAEAQAIANRALDGSE